jgi:DUF1680 family protein
MENITKNKNCITVLIVGFFTLVLNAQHQHEKYQLLPFGSVKPTGWIKTQMQKDVAGFVGNLDRIVPDLINDPIYSSARLQKNSVVKDLGNNKEGDTEGSEQYKWWNSETQSNWWDGYIRNVLLLNDKEGLKKVDKHIQEVLQSQDEDGYIGIYDQELIQKMVNFGLKQLCIVDC